MVTVLLLVLALLGIGAAANDGSAPHGSKQRAYRDS
jgi:hypothetical protein